MNGGPVPRRRRGLPYVRDGRMDVVPAVPCELLRDVELITFAAAACRKKSQAQHSGYEAIPRSTGSRRELCTLKGRADHENLSTQVVPPEKAETTCHGIGTFVSARNPGLTLLGHG